MVHVRALALAGAGFSMAHAAIRVDNFADRPMKQEDAPPLGPQLDANAPDTSEEYEYIIVGSGAGGAPLAARLALANHSVLLIDAGADHGQLREVAVPAMSIWASERSELSWEFYTHHYEGEEQTMRDRKLTWRTPDGQYYSGITPPEGSERLGNYYPRVGGLGGCTEHNAMLVIKPARNDWNYIAELTGDDSWNAENMDTYYHKLENCQYLPQDVGAHGHDGWLSTQLTPLTLVAKDIKILSIVLGAASAVKKSSEGLLGLLGRLGNLVGGLGKVLLTDINNDSADRDEVDVLAQLPIAVHSPDYRRSSPRDFVYDVATAKNADGSKKYPLHIALNTLVTKVDFDTTGEKPKATGVSYLHGQSLYRADPRSSLTEDSGEAGSVKASREVIVAGGTFNTPQILKLSGVGPRDELEKFDIPVVKDLPAVGTNLQDRYEVSVSAKATGGNLALIDECTFLQGDDPCFNQWQDNTGIFKGAYTTGGIPLAYFTHSSVAEEGEGHDIFIGALPALFQGYFAGYSNTVLNATSKDHWSWLVLKAHTRNNAGTVNLTSINPRDPPKITFHNFFEGSSQEGAEKDLQAEYEGVKTAMRIFEQTPPLEGGFERVWPPPEYESEEDLKQWIQDEAWGHHASCSCPMGADGDKDAVVNGDFQVQGIDGLRIVDASVFPKIIGTFPVLSIFMMSEKAADVILAGLENEN